MSWLRRKNEPDLEDAFPLGESHVVKPRRIIPSGLGSDVPNETEEHREKGQSRNPLLNRPPNPNLDITIRLK